MPPKLPNIILVGITGVGKTTIGRMLANQIQYTFIDLDKFIEDVCGVDIPTIFEIEGEAGFRARESLALQNVVDTQDKFVLSLGGGSVILEKNRQLLSTTHAWIIQLIADLNIIAERLSHSPNKRPLLNNQNIYQKIHDLYTSRQALYDEISHVTYNTTTMRPQQTVNLIIADILASLHCS